MSTSNEGTVAEFPGPAQFSGIGVNPGKAVGAVLSMPLPLSAPAAAGIPEGSSAEEHVARLKAAGASVAANLKLRAAAASTDAKAVLEATALMAADPMLHKTAAKKIQAGSAAEPALWEAATEVAAILTAQGGYMAERARDVEDVRARIVAELLGVNPPGIPESDQPFVLLAEDLAPADTATLDPAKVLALVTAGGGPQSHTAIIARAMGLPAVVAANGVLAVADGTEVFVDGAAGTLRAPASDADRGEVTAWLQQSAKLAAFSGTGALADGTRVPLLANVGNAHDAAAAATAGAEGVGLFRTEFLFLERAEEPSSAEQVAAYAAVFAEFSGKKVVVRTLDAGADKPLPFITTAGEPNPALGVRGYRTSRTAPEVLARQLAAIAEAAAASSADVWVMAPMVSTAAEAAEFAKLCQENSLKTTGVMIEVPAAALAAQAITRAVDFVSLGTNDLTQYTMAADRQLAPIAELNDPWQPAVLNLISMVPPAAQASAQTKGSLKSVGVCGEAAADPALAVVLAGLGVNTLSMSARALPAVAQVLASVTLAQARSIAEAALGAESAAEAKGIVRAQLPALAELGL